MSSVVLLSFTGSWTLLFVDVVGTKASLVSFSSLPWKYTFCASYADCDTLLPEEACSTFSLSSEVRSFVFTTWLPESVGCTDSCTDSAWSWKIKLFLLLFWILLFLFIARKGLYYSLHAR